MSYTSSKTPGEALYNLGRKLSGSWAGMDEALKSGFETNAKLFLAAYAPQPEERLPQQYLDMRPIRIDTLEDPIKRTTRVQIELEVPESARYNAAPGSTAPRLEAFKEALKSDKWMCRIALFTNAEIESQFNRLQEDGTVRELLPEEGSW